MLFPFPGTLFLHLFTWLIPTHPSGPSLNVTSSGKLPWLHSQTMVGAPSMRTAAPFLTRRGSYLFICTRLFDCYPLLKPGTGSIRAYLSNTRVNNMDQWMDWYRHISNLFPFWVLPLLLGSVLFPEARRIYMTTFKTFETCCEIVLQKG